MTQSVVDPVVPVASLAPVQSPAAATDRQKGREYGFSRWFNRIGILLIGCGLTEFSMTPGAITMARRVVRETSAGEMARVAARVMTLGTVDEIERVLRDQFGEGERDEVPTR